MKKEKAFIAVCAAACAVFILDLTYIIYGVVKFASLSAGKEFLTNGFLSFSVTVLVFNIALIATTAGYVLFRKLCQRP